LGLALRERSIDLRQIKKKVGGTRRSPALAAKSGMKMDDNVTMAMVDMTAHGANSARRVALACPAKANHRRRQTWCCDPWVLA
jgi:hypothetical protein